MTSNSNNTTRGWPHGALAVAAILLLAVVPQIHFRLVRGAAWNGEVAYAHGDEVTYVSYINARLSGRPRRSDPYSGRDERPGAPQAESYVSLQFVPPFVLVQVGKLLRLDASQVFLLLTVFAAAASALAVFWLLSLTLRDARLAACGAVAVLCLASTYQIVEYALRLRVTNNFLPFLRFYFPGAAFPLFFVFFACVWLAFTSAGRRGLIYACAAGLAFDLLVFSYFFLWTAAGAWLFCFALLWLCVRRDERRQIVARLVCFAVFAIAALAPYAVMLSKRAANTDEGQLLTRTFRPDFFRLPEIVGALVLICLYFATRRGVAVWRREVTLFAAACAISPFVIFNQQVLTGRSLQPLHYEMFSANYIAVLGAYLCVMLFVRDTAGRARRLAVGVAFALAAAGLASGAIETALACRTRLAGNIRRDEARPVALRLAALGGVAAGREVDTRSLVLTPDYTVGDYFPTVAPQPQLWAPHLYDYPGVSMAEDRARMMQFIYYCGEDFSSVDPEHFDALDGRRRYLVSSLISRARNNPNLQTGWHPITPDEVRAALREYADYAATFTRERAAQLPLSYLVVDAGDGFDARNLDRWYERDAGERAGRFVIYRVRLREGV
ncbi:MAG: hypothetical protein ACJ741_03110 [Pyrinomonadaceae bacterium]